MKHYGAVWDIPLVLEFQMKCFTLKIVAYFKRLTCLCSRAQGTCFWEVTAHELNSQGQQLKKTLLLHLSSLTALGEQSKIWIILKQLTTKKYFQKAYKHLQHSICINTTLLLSRSVLHMQFLGATYFGVIFNIWQSILYCCKLHTVYKYSQAAAAGSTGISCHSKKESF